MEQQWIAAAKQGDANAFLRLLSQYDRQVMSVIYRFSGNLFDREDMYQDIFLHAFQSVRKFRGEAAFATWLYRVALNRCLVYMRGHAHEVLDDQADQIDSNDSALQAIELRQRMQAVHKAMAKLKGPQRLCFHLYYIESWSHEQMAETLNISTNTVKSHLHRARTKVRDAEKVAEWLMNLN